MKLNIAYMGLVQHCPDPNQLNFRKGLVLGLNFQQTLHYIHNKVTFLFDPYNIQVFKQRYTINMIMQFLIVFPLPKKPSH